MSDSRRQYRAIKQAVKQLYPEEPGGNLARHLDTLVSMVSGIIASKSCQLPRIASQVPGDVHPDSRAKQLSRWVQNETITFDLYFLPFVQPLLERLAAVRPLVLIMDGSAVARGCVTLMVSVIYAHRAIPIGWLVIAGEKGHFPTDTHLSLLREVKARMPQTATVIFLGDGEWVIYLGTVAQEDDWLPLIHRGHRCDLSLFQLGLRLLNYLLNHDQPIPSSFALELETVR